MQAGRCCFVHGDFHHGNIVVDDQRNIIGLIDCDWCRVGHPFEDLGYLVMMCLRKYDSPKFHLDRGHLAQLLGWYGLQESEYSKLFEYLILCALYDVDVLSDVGEEAQGYLRYQIHLLGELCREA